MTSLQSSYWPVFQRTGESDEVEIDDDKGEHRSESTAGVRYWGVLHKPEVVVG